jgi:uncharacterized protein YecE (DUF72 family)
MHVWIGTSGYSYPDWVGDGGLYPAGTRPGKMLTYYSRVFPLVELNFTFYRPPTADMLARLAAQTPPGFQFLVKIPRTLSHEQSPRDLPGFRLAVAELEKRGRLLGLLCQFPQATHHSRPALRWVETLSRELAGLRLGVEFRHRSWARPDLPGWLAERGLDLVAVDVPDIPALFPRGWVQSTPRAYVRLHSRNAGNWYDGGAERYDYGYSDEELSSWVDAALRAEGTEEALFLFNNCHGGRAAADARRVRTLLAERAPQLRVAEPFAAPPPAQRSLFD